MKSIVEYINESKEGKWFRFILKEFGDGKIVNSLMEIADKNNVHAERIDGGITIKIKDENASRASKLIEAITDFLNAHSNDENTGDAYENALSALNSMESYVEEITGE